MFDRFDTTTVAVLLFATVALVALWQPPKRNYEVNGQSPPESLQNKWMRKLYEY